MNDRISELEARLNLAEDQIDALNRAAYRQQSQLDQLQAQLRLLYRQVQAAAAEGEASETAIDPQAEKPPHY